MYRQTITVDEFARTMGIARSTAYNAVRRGEIRQFRSGDVS